ncbi:unnamed protein product [Caenorhabditis auriculariae]|uniref:mitogen-activated protein kinase kinase n=1 Tax=Caenorhabditis auriculariae TaxID=2777116 RepID=A0A8S1GP48_9PELO|nr:unnamed protein product [Caenorhabditis auriculariae]
MPQSTPLGVVGIDRIGSRKITKEFYPFAFVIKNEYFEKFCWGCMKRPPVLQYSCTHCEVGRFCSLHCRNESRRDHKVECHMLRKMTDLGIEERMLARICARWSDIESGKADLDPTFYVNRSSNRTIMQLCAHTEEIRLDERAYGKFKKIFLAVEKLLDNNYENVTEDIALELYSRSIINRHSLSDPDFTVEIGKGLYLDLCRYNHSCRPNTIYSCDGTTATLRALHDDVDFDNFDETFYSYISLTECLVERRHMIRDSWYFECQCDRCVDPLDCWLTAAYCPHCNAEGVRVPIRLHGPDAYINSENMEIICHLCNRMVSKDYVIDCVGAMRETRLVLDNPQLIILPVEMRLEVLKQHLFLIDQMLPSCNSFFCALVAALVPLLDKVNDASKIDLGTSNTLLNIYLDTEEFVRYVFRYAHPAKGMHLFQTGKILESLQRPEEAARYYIEAKRIMSYAFDENFITTRDVTVCMNRMLDYVKMIKRRSNLMRAVAELDIPQSNSNKSQSKSEIENNRAKALKEKGDEKRAKQAAKKLRQKERKRAEKQGKLVAEMAVPGGSMEMPQEPEASITDKVAEMWYPVEAAPRNEREDDEDSLGDLPELLISSERQMKIKKVGSMYISVSVFAEVNLLRIVNFPGWLLPRVLLEWLPMVVHLVKPVLQRSGSVTTLTSKKNRRRQGTGNNDEMSSLNYVKQYLANSLNFPPDTTQYPFEYAKLTDIEALGNGTFGTVRKMVHNQSGKALAVKRIRLMSIGNDEGVSKSMQRLKNEVETIKASSNCDEIVKYYGITFYEGDAWLCMELMDISLETLYRIAHQVVKQPFDQTTLGSVAVATIRALEHLKNNHHIIHRDVKPSNILFNCDGYIKLCDFGICGYLQDSVAQSRDVGCRPYMAPERLAPNCEGYDVKSDVWSLGISMLEVANGRYPYPGLTEAPIFAQIQMIVYGDPPLLTNTGLSTDMCNFIMSCTIKERAQRADFNQLKNTGIYRRYADPAMREHVARYVSTMIPYKSSLAVPRA